MSELKKVKRLQFDFTIEAVEELDNLKTITQAPSRVEAVRRALRFYEYVVRHANKGYKVELSKGKDRQVLAPLSVI